MKNTKICMALRMIWLLVPALTILSAEEFQPGASPEMKNPLDRLIFDERSESTRPIPMDHLGADNEFTSGISNPWQSKSPVVGRQNRIDMSADDTSEQVKIIGLENNDGYPTKPRRLPNLSTIGLLGAGVIGFAIHEYRRKKRVAK